MKQFSGKHKCNRCGKTYNWYGYKLEKGDVIIGLKRPSHFVDAYNYYGKWIVMVYCDCGHKEETDSYVVG